MDFIDIKKLAAEFKQTEVYFTRDKAVKEYFERHYQNDQIGDILIKLKAVGDVYKFLDDPSAVAAYIQSLSIDNQIAAEAKVIVDELYQFRVLRDPVGFYGYLTRYFNWHKPGAYPIYSPEMTQLLAALYQIPVDTIVGNYPYFYELSNDLRSRLDLKMLNFYELQKFMWLNKSKLKVPSDLHATAAVA